MRVKSSLGAACEEITDKLVHQRGMEWADKLTEGGVVFQKASVVPMKPISDLCAPTLELWLSVQG